MNIAKFLGIHFFIEQLRWFLLKSNHSEKLGKITLLKHLNFQGNIWRYSFVVDYVSVLFIAKLLNVTKRYSNKNFTLQDKCINISPVIIITVSIEAILLTFC